jgi:hypothetical protein
VKVPLEDATESPEVDAAENTSRFVNVHVPPLHPTPILLPATVEVTPLLYQTQLFPDEEEIVRPEVAAAEKEPPKYIVRSAERSPPPSIAPDVLIALDEETALIDRVNAPVWLLYEMGAEADRDDVVILALKVDQSVPERKPLTPADEVAMEKVQLFPDEDVIWRPDAPDVAKEPVKDRVFPLKEIGVFAEREVEATGIGKLMMFWSPIELVARVVKV